MPVAGDFRNKKTFAVKYVRASGTDVGRSAYPRLFLIENVLRIIIHSVLYAQLGPNWWNIAVDQRIRDQVERFKQDYLLRPWHTKPGPHDIYYTHLRHLSEIIRSNKNQFDPVIQDADQWIVEIERLRLPRNIVGHMNYPGTSDRQRIA